MQTFSYKEREMRVITLAGSPRYPSRSSALLEYARETLTAADIEVCHWHLQNFAPEDLLYARFDNPALQTLNEQLAGADGLIIATPVYKASFSGALKTLLDLLPERAGGQNRAAAGHRRHHRPHAGGGLRAEASAECPQGQEILHGVFADDSQVTDYQHKPQFTPNLQRRLDDALETFWQALHRPSSRAPSLTSLRGVEHA
jgi:FMN reductase